MNKKRGIPFILSEEEEFLYNFGSEVTYAKLQEITKKYEIAANAENTENMQLEESYDINDLENMKLKL